MPHSHVHRPARTWGIPSKAAQEFASLQTFLLLEHKDALLSEEHNSACARKLPVTPSVNQNLKLLLTHKPENVSAFGFQKSNLIISSRQK